MAAEPRSESMLGARSPKYTVQLEGRRPGGVVTVLVHGAKGKESCRV